jgi:hypothetical protein
LVADRHVADAGRDGAPLGEFRHVGRLARQGRVLRRRDDGGGIGRAGIDREGDLPNLSRHEIVGALRQAAHPEGDIGLARCQIEPAPGRQIGDLHGSGGLVQLRRMEGQEQGHRCGGGDPHRGVGIGAVGRRRSQHDAGRLAHGRSRLEHRVPGLGQFEVVGAALEQGEPEGFLQRLDSPGHRGLALPQGLCGAVHRSMSHHGQEDPQVVPGRFGEGEAEGVERPRSHDRMLKR